MEMARTRRLWSPEHYDHVVIRGNNRQNIFGKAEDVFYWFQILDDIYLEHFGISKVFTVPWLSPVEEKKYLEGIKWKRKFHEMNNTKLIETYSYYSSEGILLKKLKELLPSL